MTLAHVGFLVAVLVAVFPFPAARMRRTLLRWAGAGAGSVVVGLQDLGSRARRCAPGWPARRRR